MIKNNFILILLVNLLLIGCDKKNDAFPTDKRYWDVADYQNAVPELKYGFEAGEKLPSLDDPDTKIIVEKLIDHENYKVVLDDKELGLKHKNEIAQGFFNSWKDMTDIYTVTDRKDKYLYETEMIEVQKFGLGLQLRYFKLGNDEIIESSEDPNSSDVKNVLDSNIDTLISNYLFYLDQINNESSFSENGLGLLAEGIDEYFPELIKIYPNADYSAMVDKIKLLEKKSKSEKIKTSLKNLQSLINSKKSKETTETV